MAFDASKTSSRGFGDHDRPTTSTLGPHYPFSSLPAGLSSTSTRADSESTDDENYVSLIQRRIGAARPPPATAETAPRRLFSGSEFTSEGATTGAEEEEEEDGGEETERGDVSDGDRRQTTTTVSNVVVSQVESLNEGPLHDEDDDPSVPPVDPTLRPYDVR